MNVAIAFYGVHWATHIARMKRQSMEHGGDAINHILMTTGHQSIADCEFERKFRQTASK